MADNFLTSNVIEAWNVETTPPSVMITAVSPDPRNSAVDSIAIAFSEPVSGFDLGDLTLTHDGGDNLLTGSQTLTTSNNITWTLGSLSGLTPAAGIYVLTLAASGSGITDTAGNPVASDTTEDWMVDTTAPTVSIPAISPDPRNSAADSIKLIFSEPVTGLDRTDLTLKWQPTPLHRR